MKALFSSLVFVSLMLGCGSDGKNGAAGVPGPKGDIGPKGNDGSDGTDNRAKTTLSCSGSISDTDSDPFWNNVWVRWDATTFTSGDVFVTATVYNLGSFNSSASAYYSSTQVGSQSGYVQVMVDNSNTFYIEYDSTTHNVKITVNSSNGHSDVFYNNSACQNYIF